jgi:cell wall-associated NlpC family hydrolase
MTMDNANTNWIKNNTNRAKLVKGIANGIADVIPPTTGGGGGAEAVMALAKEQIGKPYVWGGCRPVSGHENLCGTKGSEGRVFSDYSNNGTDCSGFVTWAWYWGTNKKVKLPAYTIGMYDTMKGDPSHYKEIKSDSELLPGDILLFTRNGSRSGIHHTALYEGKNKRLHAWYTGSNIKVTDMGSEVKYMFRPINY